jgi:hypothetical protein
MDEWLRRLRYYFRRRRFDAELAEEMEFHRSQSGAKQFGNLTRLQEDSRDAWSWTRLEGWARDLRYGMRQLGRNPGFAAVARRNGSGRDWAVRSGELCRQGTTERGWRSARPGGESRSDHLDDRQAERDAGGNRPGAGHRGRSGVVGNGPRAALRPDTARSGDIRALGRAAGGNRRRSQFRARTTGGRARSHRRAAAGLTLFAPTAMIRSARRRRASPRAVLRQRGAVRYPTSTQ